MPTSAYIETDTIADTLASLELAAEFHDRAQSDDRFWKWFVVALHAGVQGTFALVLERGNGLLVQKPGVTARTIAAIDAGAELPEPHMDNFLRLYRKARAAANLGTNRIEESVATPEEEAISGLDQLRDGFLHFNTKSWIIERHLVEARSKTCFAIARGLLLESGLVRMYEPSDVARAERAVSGLGARLGVDA